MRWSPFSILKFDPSLRNRKPQGTAKQIVVGSVTVSMRRRSRKFGQSWHCRIRGGVQKVEHCPHALGHSIFNVRVALARNIRALVTRSGVLPPVNFLELLWYTRTMRKKKIHRLACSININIANRCNRFADLSRPLIWST